LLILQSRSSPRARRCGRVQPTPRQLGRRSSAARPLLPRRLREQHRGGLHQCQPEPRRL